MSVYIRGMEMPTRCGRCDMCVPEADGDIDWHNVCCITGADIVDVGEKMVDCPLVPVPEPHGRLIDADVLLSKDYQVYNEYGDAIGRRSLSVYDIKEAPTIIPASKEGET